MAESLTVEITNAQWAWSDGKKPVVLAGGTHELTNPSAGLVKALGSAADAGAGVVVVKASPGLRKRLNAHLESAAQSEKHYGRAQAVRHAMLADRDRALLAAPQDEHDAIVEEFERQVDEATRAKLGEKH